MRREVADFLDYCQIERRLAPPTCSAYKRDIGTCISFLEREGIVTFSEQVGRGGTRAALHRRSARHSIRKRKKDLSAATVRAWLDGAGRRVASSARKRRR